MRESHKKVRRSATPVRTEAAIYGGKMTEVIDVALLVLVVIVVRLPCFVVCRRRRIQ